MTDDALFGSARVRRARHVCPCVVVGSANHHGASVLGRRHSADADDSFNGAVSRIRPCKDARWLPTYRARQLPDHYPLTYL